MEGIKELLDNLVDLRSEKGRGYLEWLKPGDDWKDEMERRRWWGSGDMLGRLNEMGGDKFPLELYTEALFPRDEFLLGELRLEALRLLGGGDEKVWLIGGGPRRWITEELSFFSNLNRQLVAKKEKYLGENPGEGTRKLFEVLTILPFNQDIKIGGEWEEVSSRVFENLKGVVESWGERFLEREESNESGRIVWKVGLPARWLFMSLDDEIREGDEVVVVLERGKIPQNKAIELITLKVGIRREGELQDVGMWLTVSSVNLPDELEQRDGKFVNGAQKLSKLRLKSDGVELSQEAKEIMKAESSAEVIKRFVVLDKGLKELLAKVDDLPDGYERLWHLSVREMRYLVMLLMEEDIDMQDIEEIIRYKVDEFHEAMNKLHKMSREGKRLGEAKKIEIWRDLLVMFWKNPKVLMLMLKQGYGGEGCLGKKMFLHWDEIEVGEERLRNEFENREAKPIEFGEWLKVFVGAKSGEGLLDKFIEMMALREVVGVGL